MSDIVKKTDDFLRAVDMHPQQTDIAETVVNIMSEMERGLRGEASSLGMIPAYVSPSVSPVEDEPIIVADVGGTNLRVGLCCFRDGKPVLSDIQKGPIPGSRCEITAETFFDEIAEKILPYTDKSSRIGFCFSYPAVIFPDRDGSVIRFNKELQIKGAKGAVIGRTLRSKLSQKGACKDFSFTLLNDTTAGLLGGVAELGLHSDGGLAGVVLGTGSNSCYFERGEKIKKLENAGDMIVNCESGCFSKAFRGRADIMTDIASELPGDHLLEKMIGGAYLGTVISNTAVLAAEEGLLSDRFSSDCRIFDLPELDEYIRGGKCCISAMCERDDNSVLCRIIDAAFERAARLVCANIAALCLHTDGGRTEDKPFCVVAEGSTFYKSLLFYDKLMANIDEYVRNRLGRYVVFHRAENSTLTGAALSVFT